MPKLETARKDIELLKGLPREQIRSVLEVFSVDRKMAICALIAVLKTRESISCL